MDPKLITSSEGLCAEFLAELQAHAYGIRSYTAPQRSCTPDLRYHSVVGLLDSPSSITVTLSATAGYAVLDGRSQQRGTTGFESLTALLSELSPAFNAAMHRSLSARLLALCQREPRLDGDEDEDEGGCSGGEAALRDQ